MKIKYPFCILILFYVQSIYAQTTHIAEGSTWKYYDNGNVNDANWKNLNYADTSWSNGNTQLGYGDGDEATIISFGPDANNKYITSYFRKRYTTNYASDQLCRVKADDACVVYINGQEAFRYNLPSGTIAFDTGALQTKEDSWQNFTIPSASVAIGNNIMSVEVHQTTGVSSDLSFDFELIADPQPASTGLYINEIMASNSTTDLDQRGDDSDWLELFNAYNTAVDLKGYFLSDDISDLEKYELPNTLSIPAKGYLILWASGDKENYGNHLDFKLSSGGETLFLVDPDGLTIVDSVTFSKQRTNVSFGRKYDGYSELRFFSSATFQSSNNTGTSYLKILEPPIFSHAGGFHSSSFNLSLSHAEPGVSIVYSDDGSEPSFANFSPIFYNYKNDYNASSFLSRSYQSKSYNGPISIENRTSQPNGIALISTTFNGSSPPSYFPNYSIYKGTPVRAIASKAGCLPSDPVSNTYFISNGGFNFYNLPVIALNTTESNLFEYASGLWGMGGNNYSTKAEIPISFELIGENTQSFQQNLGARLHGAYSRQFAMKTFRFYARSEFGSNTIEYPLFQDGKTDFSRFLLRNSGNDFIEKSTMMKDAFIHQSAKNLYAQSQDYRPSVVFLNGYFWGLANLRERIDRFYISQKFGVDESNIDLIKYPNEVKEGSYDGYGTLLSYFRTNNDFATNTARYDYAKTQIDLDNYIDYNLTQFFYVNTDWPTNNATWWRAKAPFSNSTKPENDGRWRWILFDLDKTFSDVNSNNYPYARSVLVILDQLLKVEEFKNKFVNRYADLLNTSFSPNRLSSLLNQTSTKIAGVMPDHIDRWATLNNLAEWQSNIDDMENFVLNRQDIVRQQFVSAFNLTGTYNLTLEVSNPSAGFIKVNSIEVLEGTDGIDSNPYPWVGAYFEGLSIPLLATANEGYKFSHWEVNGNILGDSLTFINPSTNITYKAVFSEDFLSDNPYPLSKSFVPCGYSFISWADSQSSGSEAPNAAFVYMDEEEPSLSASIGGFTSGDFDNTKKTRINGLNANGISFINTGSGQEGYPDTKLGGFLLSLNTSPFDSLKISFSASTIKANSREYNLRLQGRVGDKLAFSDILDSSQNPIEYRRNEVENLNQEFTVQLPNTLLGKPFVQLFWRYYYTGVKNSTKGSRDEIRLDNIIIDPVKREVNVINSNLNLENWNFVEMTNTINPFLNVEVVAGKSVLLLPGFKIINAVFSAETTGCPE